MIQLPKNIKVIIFYSLIIEHINFKIWKLAIPSQNSCFIIPLLSHPKIIIIFLKIIKNLLNYYLKLNVGNLLHEFENSLKRIFYNF